MPEESDTAAKESPEDLLITADVVVFGGGITGLTVAHELAERNFRVVVVDPAYRGARPHKPDPDHENPGLGGVARSQWGYLANNPFERDLAETPLAPKKMEPLTPLPDNALRVVADVRFSESGEAEFGDVFLEDGRKSSRTLQDMLTPFISLIREHEDWKLSCTHHAIDAFDRGLKLAVGFLKLLIVTAGERVDDTSISQWKERVGFSAEAPFTDRDSAIVVEFDLFTMPGEHGFRFFPSFYRHLFDTMRRIPATNPEDGGRRGRDSTYDNLVPVDYAAFVGNAAGRMAMLPRRKPSSAAEVESLILNLQRESGYSPRDMARLGMKVWKYMTSSRLRREKEYENISWYDFVEGDRFSDRGCFLVQTTPGTLVGLLGSDGDARTQGTILLQCMADQYNNLHRSDMMLNGPTDEALFGHWYRYLQSQGVRFVRGRLSGFRASSDGVEMVPMVETVLSDFEPMERRVVFNPDRSEAIKGSRIEKKVRYVIALPLLEAHEVAEKFFREYEAHHAPGATAQVRDFAALRDFPQMKDSATFRDDLTGAYPRGPLRHLSGIQYFFNQELRLWQAHTQYLDAPAGLTAIAQPQFWFIPQNEVSGYRSVLSVDIGIWRRPELKRPAPPGYVADWYPWGEERQKIAESIWQQIVTAHAGDFPNTWPKMPQPIAYNLDQNLGFSEAGKLTRDSTPFLVNETGRYRSRPGFDPATGSINYHAAMGQFVLAGTYMQTFTRITSMEAACESGRRAVNTLLREMEIQGESCEIWDPEDFEPDGLEDQKRLDEELCARGLPHVSDITGLGSLEEWVVDGGGWKKIIQAIRSSRRS